MIRYIQSQTHLAFSAPDKAQKMAYKCSSETDVCLSVVLRFNILFRLMTAVKFKIYLYPSLNQSSSTAIRTKVKIVILHYVECCKSAFSMRFTIFCHQPRSVGPTRSQARNKVFNLKRHELLLGEFFQVVLSKILSNQHNYVLWGRHQGQKVC